MTTKDFIRDRDRQLFIRARFVIKIVKSYFPSSSDMEEESELIKLEQAIARINALINHVKTGKKPTNIGDNSYARAFDLLHKYNIPINNQ